GAARDRRGGEPQHLQGSRARGDRRHRRGRRGPRTCAPRLGRALMAIVVRMPEVATGAGEAAVASWLVEVGASVTAGQPIVEIETEKAVVEFEAEESGVLAGILLAAGDAAAVGSPIAIIATGGQTVEEAMAEAGVA